MPRSNCWIMPLAAELDKMKTQPIRTCLGCRRKLPKERLLRFVLRQGNVVLDVKKTGSGRAAYCCHDKTCLQGFSGQKRALAKAFRVQDGQIRVELKDWE